MSVQIKFKPPSAVLSRFVDDDVGRFAAETWAKMMTKYVPYRSGMLSQTYVTEPFKVTYIQRYSHYQWQGVSQSGNPLNYSKDQHPLVESHWEEVAEREHKREVAKAITEYIKRR